MGSLKNEFDYKKHDKIEISKKKMLIVINGITIVSALKTGPKLTVLTEGKKWESITTIQQAVRVSNYFREINFLVD